MFYKIKKYLKDYTNTLFIIDQQKLSKGSKYLLFIFIITIFIIIGWGLSWQKHQTESIYNLYGYKCNNLVNMRKPLTFDYFKNSNSYDYKNKFGDSLECKNLKKYYTSFIKSKEYKQSIINLSKLEKKKYNIQSKIKRLKNSYGDMLLEDLSKQDKNLSILPSTSSNVSIDLNQNRKELEDVLRKITYIKTLNNYPEYVKFNNYYQHNKTIIKNNYTSTKRLYDLNQTIQAFGFLIPIWILFYTLYRILLRKNLFILSHLTIHVANISAIYGLFYLLDFIYEIMPKIFLKEIIAIFMKYNLTIFLNIFIILFFITLFGLIIYKIQKDNTTGIKKRKEEINNLSNNRCSECSSKILGSYCQVCGFKHFTMCKKCNQQKLIKANFCQHCGE
ncbi:hypothetical protein MNB_SV-9-1651 [hydrothermal vent metagenome]|uniref:DZANK-type domain-containing protein n=1 Tax=hydrothermal vent metagenome TaxID=652676 RepID=A0A1W1C220_9ZZZZ